MHGMYMAYNRLVTKNLFTHLVIIDINIVVVPDQHMLNMGWVYTYTRLFIADILPSLFDATAYV